MKKKLLFRGTGTALVTPFTAKGEIDEKALRKLVDFQIANGVEAILPSGTTGESATLTDDEQARVIGIVAEQARKRAKIIAGAGANSTAKAIALSRNAMKAGADAILSVGPYYNKPTQEGYFRHYLAIAEAVDAEIVVYNVPGRTASNIEAETTLRMAEEIPGIAGVKEASGNFTQIMEILRHRPKGFGVWSGDDSITLPLTALGADGVVSVVSNVVPKLFSEMVRLCLKGKFERAAEIHYKLLPLMNFDFVESNPIPVKAALAAMGFIKEVYRLPMVELSVKHRPGLKKILDDLKLLD
ncbi:MAG TPA: 4-hydroxy-tetrahydrodipicolinate synthase [Bacteroidota bacterium]|jgi:4-hydroxy-tetrahydrodipicolinate synthase